MTSVSPDWSVPRPKPNMLSDLDHIRLHQQIAWAAAALGSGKLVIGWNLLYTNFDSDGRITQRGFEEPISNYQIVVTYSYIGDIRDKTTYIFSENGTDYFFFYPRATDEVHDGNGRPIATNWTET